MGEVGYRRLALPVVVMALGAYLPGSGCTFSSNSCFAAGTPIATPGGPVPIEQLGVGALVYTYDAKHDRVTVHPVTQVHQHDDQSLGQLRQAEHAQPLWVTPNHPIYLPGAHEYVPAGKLRAASTVLRLADDLETSALDGVSFSATSRIDRVYNISVAGPENYFAAGVLVHNKSLAGPGTTGATSPIATAIAATSSGGSTGTNGSNSNSGFGGATSTDGGVMTTTGGAGEPGSGGAAGEAGGGGAP